MTNLILRNAVLRAIDQLEEPDGMLDLRSEELTDAIMAIPSVGVVPIADLLAAHVTIRQLQEQLHSVTAESKAQHTAAIHAALAVLDSGVDVTCSTLPHQKRVLREAITNLLEKP